MAMNQAVLVLDIDFSPLRIEHWQKAIADVFLGKTQIIECSRDRTIKCVSQEYPMPMVVRALTRFKRERVKVKFSRKNICLRDNFSCLYCGVRQMSEDLTFDHVLPKSRGGKTEWTNIVAACNDCNREKSNRTPAEAGMVLRKKPTRPRYLPVITIDMDYRNVPPEWAPYWVSDLEP